MRRLDEGLRKELVSVALREDGEADDEKILSGTVTCAMKAGYSLEEGKIFGKMDNLFEEAIELGLLSAEEVVKIGQLIGILAGKRTGKF